MYRNSLLKEYIAFEMRDRRCSNTALKQKALHYMLRSPS